MRVLFRFHLALPRHRCVPAILVAVLACAALGARGQSTRESAAEEFSLVDRTARDLCETLGARIDTTAPNLAWRIVVAPSPAEFRAALSKAERAGPFDLVFPVETVAPSPSRKASEPSRTFLADGFKEFSLPAPGLELRIGGDGTWEAVERSVEETGGTARDAPSRDGLSRPIESVEGGPDSRVVVGGLVAIVRDGVAVDGLESEKALPDALRRRPDLAPCFAPSAAPYGWIGFSRRTGKVWFGCANRQLARARAAVHPAVLARILAPESLDFVALCAAGNGSSIRWKGRWLGAPEQFPPTNEIRAALCLRLGPPATGSYWENVLRDPSVVIQPRNVADPSGLPDALRDGRIQTRTDLSAFWWATPEDDEKPIVLDIDFGSPRAIRLIEIHQAEAAGFSSHFNLSDYSLTARMSNSSAWTQVASASQGHSSRVSRHILTPPVEARWWRLEIPPEGTRDEPKRVVRLAEIQFWSLVGTK